MSDESQREQVASARMGPPVSLADPVLEPLTSRKPVAALVAERITTAIAKGNLQPGDKLPSEPKLARNLGVARTSIREALSQLQTKQIVRVVRGRGTYIEPLLNNDPTREFLDWSVDQESAIGEILEARIALETTAVAFACERATAENLTGLRLASSAHADVAETDLDALVRTDEKFHQALIESCHNSIVNGFYETLTPQLVEFRRKTLSLPGVATRSAEDHNLIVEKVVQRDPRGARAATVAHLSTLYYEVHAAASSQLTNDEANERLY